MKKKLPQAFLSIEELHHFSCSACKKWWSVGDAEKMKKEWFCPWCGVLQAIVSPKKAKKIKREF
jgi:hypothetical protein